MGCQFEDHSLNLVLGNFLSSHPNHFIFKSHAKPPLLTDGDHQPSLTLSLSPETYPKDPPSSANSSLSNTPVIVSIKRERASASSDDMETNDRVSDEDEDGVDPTIITTTRKKLRLTKDQSALLEQSFKQHTTLNPKQKQALADRLNLRSRQVEVWFQNRRARTKLKQTEVDCEYLKKCCETLTDENRKLQKEVEELKALKVAATQPYYMHLPAATLTMCPSCERIGSGVSIAGGKSPPAKTSFTKPHFFTSFPNPSAAC